jgi:transposase InsO family protein
VRETLEEAFGRCGLPQQMLMDHGSPWWNMQGAGWTRLSVWLMQQGIELRFSGYRHPQTQGKVERFHGSLHRALRYRGLPHREAWQNWLDALREEYNHERPHQALDMQTPSSRWRPSERRFDPQPRHWQYPAGS